MPKAGFIVARVSFLVLAASMLGAVMLAAPATGSTSTCVSSGKCFAVVVSLPGPAAGSSASFSFAVTNEASTQQLGSVQITAPANFVITGASVSLPGTASFTSGSALFLNLSLAPSQTTTLTVSATASCSGAAYQWGIKAKQSNDFNGLPGNQFQLDPASVGLTGSCAPCPSTTRCSASASSATTSGTLRTSKAVTGNVTAGIINYSYSCGGTYQPVSDPFSFALFGGSSGQSTTVTVSLVIDKSLVKSSGRSAASSWQICYASPSNFTVVSGTGRQAMIGGVLYHTGLLPDCSNSQGPPCVQARKMDNVGDVVVTYVAFGDPVGRG